jgi:hypothetical protein
MSNDEPSALLIARAVATYLTAELDRNLETYIPVHREVAVCALGIVKAAINELETETSPHQ